MILNLDKRDNTLNIITDTSFDYFDIEDITFTERFVEWFNKNLKNAQFEEMKPMDNDKKLPSWIIKNTSFQVRKILDGKGSWYVCYEGFLLSHNSYGNTRQNAINNSVRYIYEVAQKRLNIV